MLILRMMLVNKDFVKCGDGHTANRAEKLGSREGEFGIFWVKFERVEQFPLRLHVHEEVSGEVDGEPEKEVFPDKVYRRGGEV